MGAKGPASVTFTGMMMMIICCCSGSFEAAIGEAADSQGTLVSWRWSSRAACSIRDPNLIAIAAGSTFWRPCGTWLSKQGCTAAVEGLAWWLDLSRSRSNYCSVGRPEPACFQLSNVARAWGRHCSDLPPSLCCRFVRLRVGRPRPDSASDAQSSGR